MSSYTKMERSSSTGASKGFRLKYGRRFSVQMLRSRLFYILRHALRSLIRGLTGSCRRRKKKAQNSTSRGKRKLATESQKCGKDRDEVFYSEAIADCLEFIKRSSSASSDIENDAKKYES
uniref:Uncharacterized protein n=1 Tax=Kalanchoe fedtschenkoi TaxID=63787 RepID=A0A7N0UTU0_KALFE